MGTIEWIEEYSVGDRKIDEQHKAFVAVTNKLFQAIMKEQGNEVLLDILEELEVYTTYHFGYEEHVMREKGYPDEELREHIAEHNALKKRLTGFINEYTENGEYMDVTVFDFLRSWTDEHLSQTDMKYKRYVTA